LFSTKSSPISPSATTEPLRANRWPLRVILGVPGMQADGRDDVVARLGDVHGPGRRREVHPHRHHELDAGRLRAAQRGGELLRRQRVEMAVRVRSFSHR
jgi:hypothetical protein